VGDARVGVDDLGGPVGVLGVDLGGDQHRGVAQRARVEDRRDLADDAPVEQPLDALEHLASGDVPHCRFRSRCSLSVLVSRVKSVDGWGVRLVSGAGRVARTPSLISVRDPGWLRIGDRMVDGVFRDAVRPLGL